MRKGQMREVGLAQDAICEPSGLAPGGEGWKLVVFDTGAVRSIGRRSGALRAALAANGLYTSWVPWVLAELTGSSVYNRGRGPDRKRLQILQSSISRFDRICSRRILPNEHELMWYEAHRIAGWATPPPFAADRPRVVSSRAGVDAFLRIRNPTQVELIESDGGAVVRFRVGRETYRVEVDRSYPKHVGAFEGQWDGDSPFRALGSLDEASEADRASWREWTAGTYFPGWCRQRSTVLGLSPLVQRAVLCHPALPATSWVMGLIEGYYHARRLALRPANRPTATQNDYPDSRIAGYISVASALVTTETKSTGLRRRIQEMLEVDVAPKVFSLEGFLAWLDLQG